MQDTVTSTETEICIRNLGWPSQKCHRLFQSSRRLFHRSHNDDGEHTKERLVACYLLVKRAEAKVALELVAQVVISALPQDILSQVAPERPMFESWHRP
eukprot:scaffold405529_cov51-Prasinocladus_malaysianus.AAC.1